MGKSKAVVLVTNIVQDAKNNDVAIITLHIFKVFYKEAIESAYHEGGAGWLFDGEHDWQVEDDYLVIDSPYQVSLCEEDGTVIEENVKLRSRPDPSNAWPFPN